MDQGRRARELRVDETRGGGGSAVRRYSASPTASLPRVGR